MLTPAGQSGWVTRAERADEITYLRQIEQLAHEIADHAFDEPWFAYGAEGERAPEPLQRAINQLASALRHQHHGGDGCLEHV